ncbi:hypothetical protein FDA94_09220 [Herbidospora galbida]|uniref:Uncharacterized protein n=1 Tax=Herbidospora galbida TaxID=2575442 RepID=A0A4U3MKV2_9ACTN|nr:hypothetical protein [Herbidospora galbida]TKK89560.1 hypothetical protein FDA94_09220 [Herbidospora galbida]
MTERLIRTSYTDPTTHPVTDRQGITRLDESRLDQAYFEALHRLYAPAVHGWGVASGLGVEATPGATGVVVLPGVALDAGGRLLPLIPGGHARLPDGSTITVTAGGAALPTYGPQAEVCVTIGWGETFDNTGVANDVYITETTPVLRLRPLAGVPADGTEVVLARVGLDPTGRVTTLDGLHRKGISVAADRIAFRQPISSTVNGELTVEDGQCGLVYATPDGRQIVETRRFRVEPPGGGEAVLTVETSSGKVGVGAPDPGHKLHVYTREANSAAVYAVSHSSTGIVAISNKGTGLVVHGSPRAAYFGGDVHIAGNLTKSAVIIKIDHPLFPERKYLSHSSVESDEMKNVYDGEVTLDGHGTAEIALPDWFEALNERVRYQLTAIGGSAPGLHVSRKLSGNTFSVAGGEPGQEVCWQVTGVRHDPYARANPLVSETDKEGPELGRYLHPEPHGAAPDLAVVSPVQERS